jgi:hypothetical protein
MTHFTKRIADARGTDVGADRRTRRDHLAANSTRAATG